MSVAGFAIRPATETDLEAILALERSIPTAPHWSADIYRTMISRGSSGLKAPQHCLLVAVEDVPEPRLLGFAAGLFQASGHAELESIAVAEFARRRGVGEGLCRAIGTWARAGGCGEMLLEVRASSVAAQGLYRKLGFEEIGTRPHYYSQPEDDAILMRLLIRDQGHLEGIQQARIDPASS